MRGNYKKYDLSEKTSLVQEYIEKCQIHIQTMGSEGYRLSCRAAQADIADYTQCRISAYEV